MKARQKLQAHVTTQVTAKDDLQKRDVEMTSNHWVQLRVAVDEVLVKTAFVVEVDQMVTTAKDEEVTGGRFLSICPVRMRVSEVDPCWTDVLSWCQLRIRD